METPVRFALFPPSKGEPMDEKNNVPLDELLSYLDAQVRRNLNIYASTLPFEQKDEIIQDARLRIIRYSKKYDIEKDKGWKALIQKKSRGYVLDYIRGRKGFMESKLGSDEQKSDEQDGQTPKPYTKRVSTTGVGPDGEDILERVIDSKHHCDLKSNLDQANWDLISRMAFHDPLIHIVAKRILGFSQDELATIFRVSRERISQCEREFREKLDSPDYIKSRWVAQTIYAFGLSDQYHQNTGDLGIGYEYEPVDLMSDSDNYLEQISPQLSFDLGEAH
ncbi:MAG: hypothetical protein CMB99_15860 [Flavobacteriaceae bacterium]|nr:hypothetical protein [Flavobacteriaceae bacterium]